MKPGQPARSLVGRPFVLSVQNGIARIAALCPRRIPRTSLVSVGLISVIIMRYHLRSALHDRRRHISPPLVSRDRCDGRSIQSGALIASTTRRDRCRLHPKITFSPRPTRILIKFGNLCLITLSSLAYSYFTHRKVVLFGRFSGPLIRYGSKANSIAHVKFHTIAYPCRSLLVE